MRTQRNKSMSNLHRKKKKKSKKSKKLKSILVQNDSHHIASVPLNMHMPSGKIQDAIRDALSNATREKIVQLLFQVKEKPENCYDFDVSWWLQKFLDLGDDVNLVEAAYLIVNAGRIYERKVDLLYELVRRSVESEESNQGTDEKRQQTQAKPRRRIARQAVSVHDRLYESEMLIKQFKQVPSEKISEVFSSSSTKAPTHYFKKWAEYKVWRQNYKKKMKSAIPYSTVYDDMYLHPAMWGLSCIEDFEYDDDVDTKRNYRMFTHYMEHRYNTLVPDINFIMHFKVKDFIESEEDKMEIMKILDLPVPPSRQWPPFCRVPFADDQANDLFNVDVGESAEDYVKKYVDLEDIALERRTCEIDSELLRSAKESTKYNSHCDTQTQISDVDKVFAELKKAMAMKLENRVSPEATQKNQNDDDGHDSIDVLDSPDDVPAKEACDLEAQPSANNLLEEEEEAGVLIDVDYNEEENDATQAQIPADTINSSVERSETLTGPLETSKETDATETPGFNSETPTQTNENASQGLLSETATENAIIQIASDLAKAIKSNSPVNLTDLPKSPNPKTVADQPDQTANVIIESIEILHPVDENLLKAASDSVAISDLSKEISSSYLTEDLLAANDTTAEIEKIVQVRSKDAATIVAQNIQSNISENIVIRLSIDEGIAFSELDDIDKAMLSPVVELVDIFQPIQEEVMHSNDFNFPSENDFQFPCGKDFHDNLFRIDERYLQYEEDFSLPLEFLYKEPEIRLNIFKLPERKLRRKINFGLPSEFELFMMNRLKRKCADRYETSSPKIIRMFKLNETNIKNIPMTPPSTPHPDDDFLGFHESDISSDMNASLGLLSSTFLLSLEQTKPFTSTPNRTISSDSGIGLSGNLSDSQVIVDATIDESEELITIEVLDENIAPTENGVTSGVEIRREAVVDEAEMIEVIPFMEDGVDGCEDTEIQRAERGVNDNNAVEEPPSGGITQDRHVQMTIADENINGNLAELAVAEGVAESHNSDLTNQKDDLEQNNFYHQDDVCDANDETGMETMDIAPDRTVSQGETVEQMPPPTREPRKQAPIQDSADFERVLYEKCSNDVIEKRTSEMNLMIDRIQKWHRYLRPILAVSMERHHFDIYAIGSDIMKTFPEGTTSSENPATINLENVMEGRDPTFLSRYFLSMLQLANTNNVEICVKTRSPDKPTPLRDVQLKLRSRKRHSVAVEDNIGVIPSRKRQHATISDIDSDDEPLVPSAAKRGMHCNQTPNLAAGFCQSPVMMSRHEQQGSPARSLQSSIGKTSTPHASATIAGLLKQVARNAASRSTSPAVPRIAMSPIPGTSSSLVRSPSIVNNRNENRVSSNVIVNKKNAPPVSSTVLVSVYKSKKVDSSDSTRTNYLTPSTCNAVNRNLFPSKQQPCESIRSGCDEANQQISSDSLIHKTRPQSLSLSPSPCTYPKLIRTQDALVSVKQSQPGPDDLDSGIFSEFSTSENNSMIS